MVLAERLGSQDPEGTSIKISARPLYIEGLQQWRSREDREVTWSRIDIHVVPPINPRKWC